MPKPKGVVMKLAYPCLELATEVVTIVVVSLDAVLPIAVTSFTISKLINVVTSVVVGTAHASTPDALQITSGLVDAIMPRLTYYIMFEMWYESSHVRHDWRATRLKLSSFVRKARIEPRRLKYKWRRIRQAARHLVRVLYRYLRRKAR
jgi:hypothetical protein